MEVKNYEEGWELFNASLKTMVEISGNDPDTFAFHLTAPIGAMVMQGFIEEKVGMTIIETLHEMHSLKSESVHD